MATWRAWFSPCDARRCQRHRGIGFEHTIGNTRHGVRMRVGYKQIYDIIIPDKETHDGGRAKLPAVGKAAGAATAMASWERPYRQCEQPDDRPQPGWLSAFLQRFSWASWLHGWISSAPWPRQFPFLSARFEFITWFPVVNAYNL